MISEEDFPPELLDLDDGDAFELGAAELGPDDWDMLLPDGGLGPDGLEAMEISNESDLQGSSQPRPNAVPKKALSGNDLSDGDSPELLFQMKYNGLVPAECSIDHLCLFETVLGEASSASTPFLAYLQRLTSIKRLPPLKSSTAVERFAVGIRDAYVSTLYPDAADKKRKLADDGSGASKDGRLKPMINAKLGEYPHRLRYLLAVCFAKHDPGYTASPALVAAYGTALSLFFDYNGTHANHCKKWFYQRDMDVKPPPLPPAASAPQTEAQSVEALMAAMSLRERQKEQEQKAKMLKDKTWATMYKRFKNVPQCTDFNDKERAWVFEHFDRLSAISRRFVLCTLATSGMHFASEFMDLLWQQPDMQQGSLEETLCELAYLADEANDIPYGVLCILSERTALLQDTVRYMLACFMRKLSLDDSTITRDTPFAVKHLIKLLKGSSAFEKHNILKLLKFIKSLDVVYDFFWQPAGFINLKLYCENDLRNIAAEEISPFCEATKNILLSKYSNSDWLSYFQKVFFIYAATKPEGRSYKMKTLIEELHDRLNHFEFTAPANYGAFYQAPTPLPQGSRQRSVDVQILPNGALLALSVVLNNAESAVARLEWRFTYFPDAFADTPEQYAELALSDRFPHFKIREIVVLHDGRFMFWTSGSVDRDESLLVFTPLHAEKRLDVKEIRHRSQLCLFQNDGDVVASKGSSHFGFLMGDRLELMDAASGNRVQTIVLPRPAEFLDRSNRRYRGSVSNPRDIKNPFVLSLMPDGALGVGLGKYAWGVDGSFEYVKDANGDDDVETTLQMLFRSHESYEPPASAITVLRLEDRRTEHACTSVLPSLIEQQCKFPLSGFLCRAEWCGAMKTFPDGAHLKVYAVYFGNVFICRFMPTDPFFDPEDAEVMAKDLAEPVHETHNSAGQPIWTPAIDRRTYFLRKCENKLRTEA